MYTQQEIRMNKDNKHNLKLKSHSSTSKQPKIKISDEDFEILKLNEYNKLNEINYNVKQLKSMCKHYKLKVSGNKNELKKRISRFFIHSINAIKIQKYLRRYIVQTFIKTHGPALFDRTICVNTTDFYSLDELSEIPFNQFYSFKDNDNFIYGFDIRSIYNLYNFNQDETINPYNRKPFPKNMWKDLRKMYKFSNFLKIPIDIALENNDDELNPEQLLNSKFLTLFQNIDQLGFYTDINWLLNLNRAQKINYIRQLYDIWIYRAQLSNEAKLKICPGSGNPFINQPLSTIHVRNEFEIKTSIYEIIEHLVTRGIEQSDRWMGASYCLTALTLVSHQAAQALPWLYESVI